MKVLVYDVAAEDGGGLIVLKNFYEDVKQFDSDITWTFMTSDNVIKTADNVDVRVYKEVKSSWLSRWHFENKVLPELIKRDRYDVIISLQNMPVKKCDLPQLVYMHQSLQYCPKRFSLLKKEEWGLAIRQKLICGLIKRNLRYSSHIFVQTEWIKKATMEWARIKERDISVVPVVIRADEKTLKPYQGQYTKSFFYPARAEIYKNHQVIVDACRLLDSRGIKDYQVIFTIDKNMGDYAKRIMQQAVELPVKFVGALSYETVWSYYSKAILLFPSYLETCGLPLLEAKKANARIIASDMPFSREALRDYPNVDFFPYDNAEKLADKMEKALTENQYKSVEKKDSGNETSLLKAMLPFLQG